jgi:hypothetical protein
MISVINRQNRLVIKVTLGGNTGLESPVLLGSKAIEGRLKNWRLESRQNPQVRKPALHKKIAGRGPRLESIEPADDRRLGIPSPDASLGDGVIAAR